MTKLHIIINPVAGTQQAALKTLNDAFEGSDIFWQVSVTHGKGDATHLAQKALNEKVDIVAAYGGDGTVMEVASALAGSGTPMGILPGGTANVMAKELGIPNTLAAAAALLADPEKRVTSIDMGESDKGRFLLRLAIGFEAKMVKGAAPDLKARIGSLAYLISALKALREPPLALYRMRLDNEEIEIEAVSCVVANSGNLGIADLTLDSTINIRDGFLDVLLVRKIDLENFLAVASSALCWNTAATPLPHWQVRSLQIDANPQQRVAVDGEMWGFTPLNANIIPAALNVILPPPQNDG